MENYFTQDKKRYKIEITERNTGDNYNLYATLFDNKSMLLGRSFKEKTSFVTIQEYFKKRITDIEILNFNSRMMEALS